MSIVLVALGIACVAAGFGMMLAGRATDRASGSGFGKLAIEGPTWLVLVVIGIASTGWGVIRWEDRNPKDPPAAVTTIPDDDVDTFLADLEAGCAVGIWSDCDSLYWLSDVGSEAEWFGATCGGIFPDRPIDPLFQEESPCQFAF
jgi:hypothetical protein